MQRRFDVSNIMDEETVCSEDFNFIIEGKLMHLA